MQTLAIIFFAIAALLSAWLTPNSLALIQLMTVSGARAIALALALLFWVASGRLDSWGSSRVLLALMTMIGVASLSAGCFFVQMARDDGVPAPVPMLYRLAVGLLPLCMLAGAFLPSRKLFLIAAVLAPIAGIVVVSTWDSLHAKYLANIPKSKEQVESDALLARRTADFERLPADAGVELLLGFVNPGEPYEVLQKALGRMEAVPDWTAQLAALLDGEKRLHALYALTRHSGRLPEPVVELCWSTAERVAKDQMERLKKGSSPAEAEERMLLDSVDQLGDVSEAMRERHWREIAEVREFLVAAKTSLNTANLDSWVRHSQLDRITEAAGIAPLLEFAAPSEVWDIQQKALARIDKVPDSTAKLTKLLDGAHRLDALVVLAHRIDKLPEDLLGQCWRTAALIAVEMSKAIEQRHPPTRIDVRKLSSATGSFWVKSPALQDQRRADLAVVRNVVRAVGDDTEIAAFSWSDAAVAQPAAGQK